MNAKGQKLKAEVVTFQHSAFIFQPCLLLLDRAFKGEL